MSRRSGARICRVQQLALLVIAGPVLVVPQARSDELDVDVIETASTSIAVPPSSAACAPGSIPPMGAGAQVAPSSAANPTAGASSAASVDEMPASEPPAGAPTGLPIAVLLTLDEPRAAFALAEEAAFHLTEARAALERSRGRHAFGFVDYDPLLDRLDVLTEDLRRTFRPDLSHPHTVAPPARAIVVDGPFWRIGAPEP